jgi:hypothetical protein
MLRCLPYVKGIKGIAPDDLDLIEAFPMSTSR